MIQLYIIKVGNLYVQYISIYNNVIEEILLRPQYAKKFSKDMANKIASQINGIVVKK